MKNQKNSKKKEKPLTLSKTKISKNISTLPNKESNRTKKKKKKSFKNKTTNSDSKSIKISKISKKSENEDEKFLKQSQDTFNSKILNTDVDYSRNLISEKKVKNSIKRLIDTSESLLEEQNNILSQTDKLIQNIEVNEHEINKIQKRENPSNFNGCVNDYTENLDSILSKLKKSTKDIEFSNKIKEENNNLKYKMQMLSIDKNDDFRNIETELNSIKTVYSNEINSFLRFLNELGFDNIPIDHIAPNNLTTDKIINFFNLIKRTMKDLKDDVIEKDNQIKMMKKYNDNKDKGDINSINNINNDYECITKINNEYSKYKTDNSFNTLNNRFSNISNNNILNSNKDSINDNNINNININNSNINNSRIKKIEDLCLQHNYEDDNYNNNNKDKKFEINSKNTYQMISNPESEYKNNQSYIDNFQRSKNMTNNESNISGLGVQLEHDYSDSCFYQNMKDSYTNANKINENIDYNINKNIIGNDYISQINNQSQTINKVA